MWIWGVRGGLWWVGVTVGVAERVYFFLSCVIGGSCLSGMIIVIEGLYPLVFVRCMEGTKSFWMLVFINLGM